MERPPSVRPPRHTRRRHASFIIDRLSNNQGHNGVFAGVVTGTLPNKRNETMERISRNSRALRQGIPAGGVPTLAVQGRNDSLEQLCVRLGVIPVVVLPNATSLQGTLQAWAPRRPTPTETITVTGPTAAQTFTTPDGAKSAAFAAGGANQVLAATDSVDAAAKGRALVTIAP